MDRIRLGIVGAAGRGIAYEIPASTDDRIEVTAVCDVSPEGRHRAQEAFDAAQSFSDFHDMLWEADLGAVLIATPKEHHVPQSVAALERGLHVLCEVPAARSLEEAKELVRAVESSDGTFMLAENDVFRRAWMLVAELVADGRLGDVYYARSERITSGKEKMERSRWRRTWRVGRNGITYPTHNLGPLLRWFPGDRIDRVACSGSGHHYTDPRGEGYEQEDSVVMMAKTEQDHLIVHRQDILSDRPACGYRFELQGTGGCFESAAHSGDEHRISLQDEDADGQWQSLTAFEAAYLPEMWRELPAVASQTGRNGGDYLVFQSFVDAIESDSPPPIDVYEGLDITLPGLLSEQSIAADGEWVDVPDPREWSA